MPPAASATAADPAATALLSASETQAPAAAPPVAAPVGPAAPAVPAAAAPTVPAYNYSNNVSSQQALQDLTNFQTQEQAPIDVYNSAVSSLGIPDVRTNVTNLRTSIANTTALLNALPDDVTGRTSGSLVTEGQRDRILASESAPLTTSLGTENSAYNDASSNLNDLLNQATTQTGLVEQGNQNITSALTSRYQGIQSDEQYKATQAAQQQQFDLTVKQIQASQSQFEQQMALAQKQFAEGQREFNVGQTAASAPTANQNLLSDLSGIAAAYQSNLGKNANGLREQIIQQLTTRYGASVDPKTIANLVYNTYIPNSLENANQTAAKTATSNANAKSIMAGVAAPDMSGWNL